MAVFETWIESDLQKMIVPRALPGNAFCMDSGANLIGVSVMDGGEPATLSGTVAGKVVRSDGTTVPVTGGTLSGNKASIVLPQRAYEIPGPIAIAVTLTSGSTVTTIGAVTGYVVRSQTDSIIDPGTILPTIDTLINQIQTAIDSIPADYSQVIHSIAPSFSSSTAYSAGDMVWYPGEATNPGALYQFTSAHAAGDWTGSDATAVTFANELSALKSAFDAIAEFHGDNVFDKTHPQTKPLYINPATSKFANAGDQRLVYVSVDQGVNYSVKCGGASTKRIGFCASIPATSGDVNSISQVVGPLDLTINSGNNQYLAIQLFIDSDSDRTPSNYYDSIEIVNISQLATTIKNSAIIMDSVPTAGSDKPVTSGGVYDALAGKQSVLTFDDEPVSGSVNPVKSGGVYEAVIPVSETIKTELIVSRNLLNINDPDYKPDTKLSTTYGTPTNATGNFSTGFIPVEEGKTYNWIYGTSIATSQVMSRICAYGSDKSYKSAYTLDSVRGFIVPENSGIAYVRFSGNMSHMPPTEQNVMFTEGIPDRYYEYFTPYNKYTIKNSALDDEYIQTLGGEKETIFPQWELGAYNNSWNLTDSTNAIRSDYIPVGDRLVITVPNGYQAKVYPFDINGKRNATHPYTVKDKTIITPDLARFVRIVYSAATPETIVDPGTYALSIDIVRYGNQHEFYTEQSATPNVQDVNPAQVLPGYLALVAVKEKFVSGKMIETVGYLYRTVTAPHKLYYSQGKPDNIKYLCDWDTSIAGAYNNTPMYYCFAITDEGDIICVHRGEIESAERARDNPIVYPHTDYAHPVLVELTGEKPTSWISNCGCYAEPGHFWFGEYIRDVHTHANVWNVSAPYTNASDWIVEKTYERDTNPSDPSSMVLGKIEHIHCVEKDPFTGILYVTTGDHHTEARIDYLKDGTWGILREADEEVCRQLNFIFTPTYVYWASDAFSIYDPDTQQMVGGAHKFFRASRLSNGLIDLDTMEIVQIPALDGSIATYHVAYVKDPECILILDRHDDYSAYFEMPYRVWNIKEERMEFAGNMKQARGSVAQYLGFRCECCQHYPNLFDSVLPVGFSLYPNTLAVCGNPNPDIIPSMGGRTTDDSKNAEQVNTMALKVIRA